jgi:hypothetical protein
MNSRPSRLVLSLLACCVVAFGASSASASAATTMNLTTSASPRVNQNMTITTSGTTDQDGAQLQVYVELNGMACNGTNGGSLGNQSVDTAGGYSKDWTFKPTAIGSYHVCGYLRYPPDPTPQIAQADVQVHDQLSVYTQPASSVAGHAATFSGGVQEASESSQSYFEYGTTTSYGNVTPTQTVPANSNGTGFVFDNVVSLQPATPYHYRLVATDSGGTVYGDDRAFTTDPASSMTMTVPASRFRDEDWPVTLSGSAGSASSYAIYVETDGSSCAASDASEGSRPGATRWRSGNVAAGQYSVELPQAVYAQPTPGTYLVCAYLDSSNRAQGPSEASASAAVTVSYRACPNLDFSVTGASEQTGDRAVFDAVLPAEVGGKGTVVYIASSDGGRTVFTDDYRPAGENYITHGGPQQVSTLLNKKKSFLPSFDGPVTVTFTFTYAVVTPYDYCTLPDGTVEDGGQTSEISGSGFKYPVVRSAPQTIAVTFRNHGTPPGGAITPGIATDIENAVADALTPAGSAAKIGAILKNGYKAPFVAKAAGQVTGAWYFVPKGAHVAGKPKPVLVASGKTTVTKPGRAKLKLRLSKKGKALLKKAKKIKLTSKGTFTPRGGKKLVVKRTIKLKR